MAKVKHKIKDLGLEQTVLESNVTPKELERQLRNKGISITDDTIRRYKETVIKSGILDIDLERKQRIERLIDNSIEIFEQTQTIFKKNLNIIKQHPDLWSECKTNPQIAKLLNQMFNQTDKIIRLIQLLNPSKAIDIELIKKQKRRTIQFTNL